MKDGIGSELPKKPCQLQHAMISIPRNSLQSPAGSEFMTLSPELRMAKSRLQASRCAALRASCIPLYTSFQGELAAPSEADPWCVSHAWQVTMPKCPEPWTRWNLQSLQGRAGLALRLQSEVANCPREAQDLPCSGRHSSPDQHSC